MRVDVAKLRPVLSTGKEQPQRFEKAFSLQAALFDEVGLELVERRKTRRLFDDALQGFHLLAPFGMIDVFGRKDRFDLGFKFV